MFLEKINNFNEESARLKTLYSSHCKICNGKELIKNERGQYVTCKCIKKANINARLICNGLPTKYLNINWDNINDYIDDKDSILSLKNYTNNLDQNIFDGKNIFIKSDNKNKTMILESAFCNNVAFKRNYKKCFYNILIVTCDDLMQTQYSSRNNYEIKNELNKVINNVDILIINFLGEETDNRNEIIGKYIDSLINSRGFNNKLTFLSSAYDMDKILNKYGVNLINTIKQNFKFITLNETNNFVEVGVDDNGYY